MGKDCAERVEKGVDSNGNPPVWVESCFDSAVSHQKNCLHCRNSHLRVCPFHLVPFTSGSVPVSESFQNHSICHSHSDFQFSALFAIAQETIIPTD